MSEAARSEDEPQSTVATEAVDLLFSAFLKAAPRALSLELLHALAERLAEEEDEADVVSIRANTRSLRNRREARAWIGRELPRWLGAIR